MRHRRTSHLAVAAITFAASCVLATAPAYALSGGTPVSDDTYGFVAKLDTGTHACTGALIAPLWVVTASACFPENTQQPGPPTTPTTVTVGRANLTTTTGRVVHVATLIPRTDRNLILAKLDSPVTAITPLALPTTTATTGTAVTVAGFGRTTTDWVPDQLRTTPFTINTATDTALTLTSDSGVDTCKGDAGGPATRTTNGHPELVALNSTSWQHGCLTVAETRQGSTEARVDNITDWITQQIQPRPVQFKNHVTSRCLLARASNNTNNAPITQFDCVPPFQDQVWDLIPTSNGYQIHNQATNRCLLTRQTDTANGAPVLQFDCAPFEDQVWDLVAATNGYQIRNHITNRCLLARGGSSNVNGAPVLQFDCVPPFDDQVWDILPTTN
jgi:hypothetical protein